MILIIGGRSKIGSALIEELRARGEKVRVLIRGQETNAALPGGVEAVAGDLGEPESLRAAMAGADKVFLLSSPHRDAVQWHRNAIDAARASGVALVVRSSIIGADRDRLRARGDRDGLCLPRPGRNQIVRSVDHHGLLGRARLSSDVRDADGPDNARHPL